MAEEGGTGNPRRTLGLHHMMTNLNRKAIIPQTNPQTSNNSGSNGSRKPREHNLVRTENSEEAGKNFSKQLLPESI